MNHDSLILITSAADIPYSIIDSYNPLLVTVGFEAYYDLISNGYNPVDIESIVFPECIDYARHASHELATDFARFLLLTVL